MNVKKTIVFLSVFIALYGFTHALEKPEFISIEKLVSGSKIKVSIQGTGGHSQNCVEFDIKNLTSDTVRVLIEPGRRLVSADSALQDIFIVKTNEVLLSGYESKSVMGYGFCCQSSNKGPKLGSVFSLGYMAPEDWVTLANVIDKNDFPSSAVQSAVWTVSNNHSSASIVAKDLESIKGLRQVVADIKNEEIPWYTLTYEQDTAILFTNRANQLAGNFNYELKSNTVITVHVTNSKGSLVKILSQDIHKQKGKYQMWVDLNVKAWPKGGYTVRIYEGNHTLNSKMEFVL